MIRETFEQPLEATGKLRHFWVTVDKATMHRITMQCIVIVAVNEGVKTIFPDDSPAVYSADAQGIEIQQQQEDDDDGFSLEEHTPAEDVAIHGGSSSELAAQIKSAMKTRLKLSDKAINCIAGKFSKYFH